MNAFARNFGLALASITVAGCASLGFYDTENVAPFEGISDAENLVVLHVHGISCHKPGYSNYFQYALANRFSILPASETDADITKIEWDWKSGEWQANHSRDPFFGTWVDDLAGLDAVRSASKVKSQYDKANSASSSGLTICDAASPIEGASQEDPIGTIAVREFSDPIAANTAMRYVEITWSPLSEYEKLRQVGYDGLSNRSGPYSTDRALLNDLGKRELLNDKFSDAVYYLGPGGKRVRELMRSGICTALLPAEKLYALERDPCAELGAAGTTLAEGAAPNTRIVLISESAGSRVLFDTLIGPENALNSAFSRLDSLFWANRSPPKGQSTVQYDRHLARTGYSRARSDLFEVPTSFYMFANQLPLLELAFSATDIPSDAFNIPELESANSLFSNPGDVRDETFAPHPFDAHFSQCMLRSRENLSISSELERLYQQLDEIEAEYKAQQAFDSEELREFRTKVGSLVEGSSAISPISDCLSYELSTRAKDVLETVDYDVLDQVRFELGRSKAEELASALPAQLMWDWTRLSDKARRASTIASQTVKPNGTANYTNEERVSRALNALTSPIEVIAFSDRNDLLSYELSDRFGGRYGRSMTIIDVPTKLQSPFIPLRGKMGVFANPAGAHLNHKYSRDILNLILCGVEDGQSLNEAVEQCAANE